MNITINTLFPDQMPDLAKRLAQALPHSKKEFVSPTPLVSKFWKGTFTPSSSEVIFREILAGKQQKKSAIVVQPCIRVSDLTRFYTGWHRLLFHMFSFVRWNLDSYKSDVSDLLGAITTASNLSLDQLVFTVSTYPSLGVPSAWPDAELGHRLLLDLGVDDANIALSAGSDNYQDTQMPTDTRHWVAMSGPKVEVFVRGTDGYLREIATFEIALVKVDGNIQAEVFAFAIGLERLETAATGKTSFIDNDIIASAVDTLAGQLLHPTLAQVPMGREGIYELLLLFDAIQAIAPLLAQEIEIKDRGFRNHARRILRRFWQCSHALGVAREDFTKSVRSLFLNDFSAAAHLLRDTGCDHKLPDYVE